MKDSLATALAALPHGPEFRFLDRLLALDPGKSGTAEYRVRGDEPFLRGHFPGQPLFPGVLLVEAAAQLAGTVAQSDPDHAPMPGLKLTALRAVKILGSARPGETLLIESRITGRMGALIQAEATVSIDAMPILQAQITLSGESPRSC
jgi:3-hydroxyacyl-[acyl-carrier-protein] dehydratase